MFLSKTKRIARGVYAVNAEMHTSAFVANIDRENIARKNVAN
jgi:hypothetical protein